MDHDSPETLKDPGGEPGLTADWDSSESFCAEKDQRRCTSCMVTEDLTTNASWSQRSISRSLQRAETLLRSTFNPSLKWLFHSRSQDENAEEGNFVAAPNLVSRSSSRLLRLQQTLLTVAPQWQQVGGTQVCVKGLPTEGGVLLLPSSSSMQGHYRALWRLLEQRSLLLFVHEYIRRVRLTAAFISRVSHQLEDPLKRSHLQQDPSAWSSLEGGLTSLSQELRVHLNHWSCLVSKVQADDYLRPALVQHSQLLVDVKQTLDSLGLQALVLMEQYVYVILSAVAQTDLNSVPREVLEDVLAGTDLYNQAVEEQRAQRCACQLRTAVLQQAHHNAAVVRLRKCKGHHPATFSVKDLTVILAAHRAETAAERLHHWVSEERNLTCRVHNKACTCSDSVTRGSSALKPDWTWENLHCTYLDASSFLSVTQQPSLPSASHHACRKNPLCIPDLHLDPHVVENHPPVLARPAPAQQRTDKKQTKRQANISTPRPSALPLSEVFQQDHSSAEFLFQVLVSSSDLLAPLVSQMPEQLLPNTVTDVLPPNDPLILPAVDSVESNRLSAEPNKDNRVEGTRQEWAELEIITRAEAAGSSGFQTDGDPDREETVRISVEPDCARCPPSVQWLDLGQSLAFDDLYGQYRAMLWKLCSKALWLQLHVPPAGNAAGSTHLQGNQRVFQILHQISQASERDLVPKECRSTLEDLSLYLLVITSHAQWDYEACRCLGSSLKDKCLTVVNRGSNSVVPSPKHGGGVMMSATMDHFMLVSPPLLSALRCRHSNSSTSGCVSLFLLRLRLQRHTLSLALATVQLSTVWVMSKAYQFLSSWSLNKFLLITQGDLKVLREWLEVMVHHTKSLMMSSDGDHHSTLHNHNQLQLRQQLETLDRAVCELQTFSSLVLKAFSRDCKRMSGEIFEQTMPSATHWRPRHRTGFPISPSEYASLAAQAMIGQVLESVAPLSDDARVQALSITMTAFMEAWMEHILKKKIKFSVQGALQLKQDFDSIREMIQSDKYGLSAELHQRLLSLRVFQQVDSAVVCLLQQPQAKPYLQARAWEPFTSCCPSKSSRGSIDAAVGSSITNLRCVEGEDLSDPSPMTSDFPTVDPPTPGEPYLAPSAALGAAQQEWLNLRIHGSSRRWRLPGLQCLYKSEP